MSGGLRSTAFSGNSNCRYADFLIVANHSSAELLIGSVLATLTSEKTKQAYAAALTEFLAWITGRGEPLSKPLLETWRGCLLARGLSVSSVNQRLSAVRLLLRQAADRGALPMEEALPALLGGQC